MPILTESGSALTTFWLERVDSTQKEAGRRLENTPPPFAVVADVQTQGQGSRGNRWEGEVGNLFFSFAVARASLPDDLKLESSSIYFAFLLKEVLARRGSNTWLKWPNDFYLDDRKIGGTITTLRGDALICGIGLNLCSAPEPFGIVDIDISRKALLDDYFAILERFPKWKQIFRKYALEFECNRRFQTHFGERSIPLEKAVLCEDGAVECEGQRIYSLR